MLNKAQEAVEKKFNLPKFGEVAELLKRFPDDKQLREVKDMLAMAEKLAGHTEDLEKVVEIIHEINAMPTEKIVELNKLVKRIQDMLNKTPKELVGFFEELKKMS